VSRYGQLLPNPSGEGKDYGIKMDFFDRKLFIEAVHYTNSNVNAAENITSGTWGDFGVLNPVWNAIAAYTQDPKYTNTPYLFENRVTWFDNVSRTSKGWEFSVTAKPTKGWKMVFNGSKRGNQTATDRGVFITQYLNEFLPIIKANPVWMTLDPSGVPITNPTAAQLPQLVSTRVAGLESTLANFKSIQSLPSSHFAPAWTFNMIQSYSFKGALKGFSAGATMRMRGKSIAGFQVDDSPTNPLLVPSKPYYASGYTNYGLRVSYNRKVFNGRVGWTLQLNVNNVLDNNTVYPIHIVDRRDGTHLPTTAVYGLREPRTYQITNTFKF
jgi:hypothetical protein